MFLDKKNGFSIKSFKYERFINTFNLSRPKNKAIFDLILSFYNNLRSITSYYLLFFPRWDTIDGFLRKSEIKDGHLPEFLKATTATNYNKYVKHDFLQQTISRYNCRRSCFLMLCAMTLTNYPN